uniref:Glucosylceramidase-like n=1 Tax=Phallusia mammillata TaxID=59560 RepID=A0A6F9DEA0_9ASCI|nr:glucosylceramidase-like [Phallusia mammillata]
MWLSPDSQTKGSALAYTRSPRTLTDTYTTRHTIHGTKNLQSKNTLQQSHHSHRNTAVHKHECKNIARVLRNNGFPRNLHHMTRNTITSQNRQFKSFTCLPYVQGVSERLKRILNDAGVKVAMKPLKTIGQLLPKPKDATIPQHRTGVVYQVPCRDCDMVYIGQTKRNLNSRLKEHKVAVKNMDVNKSALCEHVFVCDHRINWNDAQVLKQEPNWSKRLVFESCLINSNSNVLNRNDGKNLSAVFRDILRPTSPSNIVH